MDAYLTYAVGAKVPEYALNCGKKFQCPSAWHKVSLYGAKEKRIYPDW